MSARFKTVVTSFALTLAIGSIAMAQTPSGPGPFPDVLGDIFGPRAPGKQIGQGDIYIENIPVQVSFDNRANVLPPEAVLIVTAIAPPAENVRRASPLVMGETRLLISRLAPPLQMVIAVPSDKARDVPYAQITARIVDAQGNITHEMTDSVQYDGQSAPFLNLTAIGRPAYPGAPLSPGPSIGTQLPVSGSVVLGPGPTLMRGGTLVIRVTETILAGGVGGDLLTEERIPIDQASPPFSFELLTPTGPNNRLDDPQIEAFIEDWAGRKIYVSPRPVSIALDETGRPQPARLRLDSIATGTDALEPGEVYVPPVAPSRAIRGQAKFEAPRGLPSGCRLNVRLKDTRNMERVLSEDMIYLDGLSGYVDYSVLTEARDLGDRQNLVLEADITDANGRVLFRSTRLPSVSSGATDIRLEATPDY